MIRTVDTDIVVLAIALYLPIHGIELCISLGVGDKDKICFGIKLIKPFSHRVNKTLYLCLTFKYTYV